jgi:hypothetical protein
MVSKNLLKITFDFVMTLLLAMIYSVSGTGVLFHEIAGLIIFIFFSIHLFYNRKWIMGVSKKIFDKTINEKTKTMYIIDILLFCSFMAAGLSGIFISKELFKIGITTFWRYVHVLSSAISLLAMGIHIGLHGNMIIYTIKQYIHISGFVGKTISIIMLLIILMTGFYGIIKTNEQTNDYEKNDTRSITVLNLIIDVFNSKETKGLEHKIGSKNEFKQEQIKDTDNGKEGNNLFNVQSTVILATGYLSVIILCGIIVYLIEKTIRKRKIG